MEAPDQRVCVCTVRKHMECGQRVNTGAMQHITAPTSALSKLGFAQERCADAETIAHFRGAWFSSMPGLWQTHTFRIKLTWLVLGGDPAARSHRVEQFTAL